jgi:tetratricopeptide (TPR) repeat protein
MRFGLAVATALLLATTATSALASASTVKATSAELRPAPATTVNAKALAVIDQALQRTQAQDAKGVLALLEPLVDSESFKALPPLEQGRAYYMLGLAAWLTDQPQKAHRASGHASVLAGASGWDWLLRLESAEADKDQDDAVYALEMLVQYYPDRLADVDTQTLARLYNDALKLPRGEVRQMAVMNALLSANWTPEDPLTDWSTPWAVHAARLLDRQDSERAALAAKRVRDPGLLMGMRADNRFADLVRQDPATFDIRAAYAREVELARSRMSSPPTRSDAISIGWPLLAMDRHAEALAIAQEVLAREARAGTARTRLWGALELRARALRGLGRLDEAAQAWRETTVGLDDDFMRTSAVAELARHLVDLDQPREALTILDTVDIAQPSMAERVEATRVCAHAQLGETAAMNAALARLEATEPEATAFYQLALTCAGDLDMLADILIQRLRDPESRVYALADVQDHPKAPRQTAYQRTADARREALLARPDVRAAIARVGKVQMQPYPLVIE